MVLRLSAARARNQLQEVYSALEHHLRSRRLQVTQRETVDRTPVVSSGQALYCPAGGK